ncbi:cytochrome P450 [Trametes meyenii]|nr:cytochrome P450 [Trametes meyenii]
MASLFQSLPAVSTVLLCAGILAAGYVLRQALHIYRSPLCLLRGPPDAHILFGNIQQVAKVIDSRVLEQWIENYGYNCLTRWFLSIPCLWTADPRTLNHILTHSYDYPKPWEGGSHAVRLLGPSMLITEGDAHRKQRRVLNPAFGPAQIRELTDIFIEKTTALRDLWRAQAIAQGGCLRTNVIESLGKSTLDIIGIAGFNYRFDALNPKEKPNELNEAFYAMFKTPPPMTFKRIFGDLFPFLNFSPDERSKKVAESRAVMRRIGMQLINDKKAEITRLTAENAGGVEKKNMGGRDLLTLLIKANMAVDIPDSQRLSDEEVLSQVVTFLVAGQETMNMATTWTLYALTQAPTVQRKLREELLAVPTASPTMDELAALPYLDAVVREALRMYPPVATTLRMANRDDVLPVTAPFVDRHGNTQTEVRIAKGNRIVVPIAALNRLKSVWGDDAAEFKPERWEHPPAEASNLPGIWAHILTFLGGPRACIATRFSVIEYVASPPPAHGISPLRASDPLPIRRLKSFLFSLVREFEFELAVPAADIVPVGTLIQRPNVRSELDKGAQLPLLIRPHARD